MKRVFIASLIATLALAANGFAADAVAVAPTAVVPASIPVAVSSAPVIFQKPVALRGTVGDVQIQVNLRPKEEVDEGHEGEYFIFGNSNKILLAGEIEKDGVLFMEESVNGKDISGQWDGKLEGDVLAGTWMSADGSITKPFSLKIISPVQKSSQKQTLSKAVQKGVVSKQ
ncbi:hypothetical protein EV677_1426 [Herminiimonas fonticola]|uniref:Uncharacterized protein n=2 Tax=Herminiimonas fonticola TaxID=303380 RepID=A0A4R6GKW2_9BURK|nr:hypothetical protein Hfont_1390 [Herminiimonas fonticola]TDN94865.1 hypothetical protein EV677_1426 [Herminiimonas fonticola]